MRCANPQCQVESNYLRDGSLYWIDELIADSVVPQRRFIWLCSKCSSTFSVETWRPPGQQLRPAAADSQGSAPLSAPRRQPRRSIPRHPVIPDLERRARA